MITIEQGYFSSLSLPKNLKMYLCCRKDLFFYQKIIENPCIFLKEFIQAYLSFMRSTRGLFYFLIHEYDPSKLL